MFGTGNNNRGIMRGNNNRGLLFVLVPLLHEIQRLPFKPIVTLGTLAILVLIHMTPLSASDWGVSRVCISAAGARSAWLFGGPLAASRLVMASALSHASDAHLAGNAMSFLHKGAQLEKFFGLFYFGLLLIVLTFVTQAIYSPLSLFLGKGGECAIGFSGVIFALKVLCQSQLPGDDFTRVANFTVPAYAAAWVELFIIQLISPHSSFVAHLAGILAGLGATFSLYILTLYRKNSLPKMSSNQHRARSMPSYDASRDENNNNHNSTSSSSSSRRQIPWHCPTCTLRNAYSARSCAACSAPRPPT